MRIYDIIEKKRDGGELSDAEIAFFVDGYTRGDIPDYQASALLMAIFLRGMTNAETTSLTMRMMHSGDVVDLSSVPGVTVDKHSTGGVGDKTSIALVPLLAAIGHGELYVAKMTGRGLGHTGGTIDKLESIPGFSCSVEADRFLQLVRDNGAAIIGQTGNLVPADKKLYALRDVTATVSSIPLIASSIMSKKLAAGADCILLDVKVGSGAFMKTVPDAVKLAQTMVAIGEGMNRRVQALVTNMDRPLGHAIGNALEVREVVETLRGNGPEDLAHEAVLLAATLLNMALGTPIAEGEQLARETLTSGTALAKLRELVAAQGGDPAYVDDPSLFADARLAVPICAPTGGFISHVDAEKVGIASAELGAGRLTLDDAIDPAAGITLLKNYGDTVQTGEPIAVLHANDEDKLAAGKATFERAFTYSADAPADEPLVYATVTRDGVTYA